jgi:hypothetical protein
LKGQGVASQVDAINTALGFLGKEPVADLTPASLAQSVAATKLMRSIETAKRTVLRRHGWLSALSYVTLLPSPAQPQWANFRYPSLFLLPGDCLRVWEIAGDVIAGREVPDQGTRWQVLTIQAADGTAQTAIAAASCDGDAATTLSDLNVAYVRNASWASLDDNLADAIAYDAAKRQARSILGSASEAAAIAKEAEAAIAIAISVDGTQEGGQPPLAPSIPQAIRRFAGSTDGYGRWGWPGFPV